MVESIAKVQGDMCDMLVRVARFAPEEQYRLLKQFRKMIENDLEMSFESTLLKALNKEIE